MERLRIVLYGILLVIPITVFHIAAGNYSSLSANENEYNIVSGMLQEKAANVIEGCVSENKVESRYNKVAR